jgi:hypothetical protein
MDWTAALSIFGLESAQDHRSNGKTWSKGLGRVLDGATAIERLRAVLGGTGEPF